MLALRSCVRSCLLDSPACANTCRVRAQPRVVNAHAMRQKAEIQAPQKAERQRLPRADKLGQGSGFLLSDRGEVALKGFDEPVRLYEVRWEEKSARQ